MNKILIVCAQLSEAQGMIARFEAKPVENETIHVWSEGTVYRCYHFAYGKIVICNVGLHAAQMAVAHYGRECEEIWNFGLAGALNPSYSIGDIVSITQVDKYIPLEKETLDPISQECMQSTLPSFSLQTNPVNSLRARLISTDFPIHDPFHRQRLKKNWDLVDMEGYGIAFASHYLKKKYFIWKIISDFASIGGRELIHFHKANLAEKIGDFIEKKFLA